MIECCFQTISAVLSKYMYYDFWIYEGLGGGGGVHYRQN